MPVTVVVRFRAKPGRSRSLRALLEKNQPDVARSPGFRSIALYMHLDEPDTIVEIESWDTADAHREFLGRTDAAGGFDALMELVSGEPEIDYLTTVAAYPPAPPPRADE